MNILSQMNNDKVTEMLLLNWANEHPYLFTIIKVTEPYLFVIIAVVGINIINGIFRGGRNAKNRY